MDDLTALYEQRSRNSFDTSLSCVSLTFVVLSVTLLAGAWALCRLCLLPDDHPSRKSSSHSTNIKGRRALQPAKQKPAISVTSSFHGASLIDGRVYVRVLYIQRTSADKSADMDELTSSDAEMQQQSLSHGRGETNN